MRDEPWYLPVGERPTPERAAAIAARFRDEVRPALGAEDLPALLCGMIGSNLGWAVVPYQRCPADLDDLARALHALYAPGRVDALRAAVRPLDGEQTWRAYLDTLLTVAAPEPAGGAVARPGHVPGG